MANFPKLEGLAPPIYFQLLMAHKRLTLDITYQHPQITYHGADNGDYYKFTASNGYEIISRSQMDIQTERIYILGAKGLTRSGTMVFADNVARDLAYYAINLAFKEWENAIWTPF